MCVVRHHTGVTRQTGVYAKFLHAFQYLFLKAFALTVPRIAVWTAPTLQIVHEPPCLECRTGNEGVGFGFGVAETQQHVAPDGIGTHDVKAEVDAVQSHPVEFLLPALPVPKSHGVREGAVVEVVAVLYVGVVPLCLFGQGQRCGQRGVHGVP